MWFIRFAAFCAHEYYFHAYIWTTVVQTLFFILFSAKDSLLFMINSILCFKFSSTSSGQWKPKSKNLGSLITIIFSSIIIMTRWNCCKLVWWFYCVDKRYSIFLISFFNLYELFPAFIYTNNIGSLLNNLFGVMIFNPFPSFTSSSSSRDDISDKSTKHYYTQSI